MVPIGALILATLLQTQVVVRDWLVVGPTERRARRPFNPSGVFASLLLDPATPLPKEGDPLVGENGRPQTWRKVAADANGNVAVETNGAACAEVEWPVDGVALADLDGASFVWVNGTPQIGDPYGDGMGGLPVALKRGRNRIVVSGVRGGLRLAFTAPEAELLINPFDVTRPDIVVGEGSELFAAILLVNASDRGFGEIALEVVGAAAESPFEPSHEIVAQSLGPRGILKVPFTLKLRAGHAAFSKPGAVEATIRVATGALTRTTTLHFEVKAADALARRTRRSPIDGSVQEFALLPPESGKADGLVLTLHGAGVDCAGQAAAYSKKPDFWICAPTNRRRFGFDWQDWGRRDAYETLAEALRLTGVSPDRVCLTGHSMGGHGTWHLAANDPWTFCAMAPSAGWSSFDTYGGGRPDSKWSSLWKAADGASGTLALLANLAQLPTYVLHGTKDDNVPVGEAQLMIDALTKAGAPPQFHLQEGAGHWWDGDAAPGADCVDWPPIFELFRKTPPRAPRDAFTFVTADPSVTSKCDAVEIVQPIEYGRLARVAFEWAPAAGAGRITTENVRRMVLEIPLDDGAATWEIDGQKLELDARAAFPTGRLLPGAHERATSKVTLVRENGTWSVAPQRGVLSPLPAGEKSPSRSGPLKRAFDHDFVLVYASHGDAKETALSYERARVDAATWWYRANGHAEVLRDDDFLAADAELAASGLPATLAEWRSVVLYGNEETNSAWPVVVDDACPIHAKRGKLTLGAQSFAGDALAAAFVRPRVARGLTAPDHLGRQSRATFDTDALVAVFADTGVAGARTGFLLPCFVSGVGFPDYTLLSSDVATKGDGGVLAAGWFAHDWTLPQK